MQPWDAAKILEEDYSTEFDELRKNRVVQSRPKYGRVKENYANGLIEALPSAERALQKFRETGNKEYLVDASNYCMFEFMYSNHPNAHFRTTGDGESAGIVGMSEVELREAHNHYEKVD